MIPAERAVAALGGLSAVVFSPPEDLAPDSCAAQLARFQALTWTFRLSGIDHLFCIAPDARFVPAPDDEPLDGIVFVVDPVGIVLPGLGLPPAPDSGVSVLLRDGLVRAALLEPAPLRTMHADRILAIERVYGPRKDAGTMSWAASSR